jgi:hypothetical protein
VDKRSRFHLTGVAVGVIVAIYAAIEGDWAFAIVFAVASLVTGLGVLHRIRKSQRDDPPQGS